MASYRTKCEVTRGDNRAHTPVVNFETHSTVTEARDFTLSLGNSESYTVTGFTAITDFTVISPDKSTVEVEVTSVGHGHGQGHGHTSFTTSVDNAWFMRGASLTGLKVTNPSGTTTIKVRLLVGGT